jgi:hypothetical protein
VPAATVPSRREVPRARLPAALPTRKLTGGAPARLPASVPPCRLTRDASAGLPASLRVLFGARRSGLSREQNPVPPALPDRCERRALRRERDRLSAPLSPSLHGCAPMSDDRVPRRPTDIPASVPGVQRQQPLLSLSRGARRRLAGDRARQTIAT